MATIPSLTLKNSMVYGGIVLFVIIFTASAAKFFWEKQKLRRVEGLLRAYFASTITIRLQYWKKKTGQKNKLEPWIQVALPLERPFGNVSLSAHQYGSFIKTLLKQILLVINKLTGQATRQGHIGSFQTIVHGDEHLCDIVFDLPDELQVRLLNLFQVAFRHLNVAANEISIKAFAKDLNIKDIESPLRDLPDVLRGIACLLK